MPVFGVDLNSKTGGPEERYQVHREVLNPSILESFPLIAIPDVPLYSYMCSRHRE